MGISCFSCGLPMRMLDEAEGFCDDCQVREERTDKRSRLCLTSGLFYGAAVRYLDHGAGSYPSPA